MTDILVTESGDISEALDMEKAAHVGEILNYHYPGYLWFVNFQGGVLVVKLGQINASETISRQDKGYGFVIKHASSYSATQLAHDAVMAGGEILERAGLKRGKWDGTVPDKLDVS